MLKRKLVPPPEYIYPIDEWKMIEQQCSQRYLAQNETIFALGNGYLGMRGTFEEGAPVFQNGTFVNGFHETWPIVYGERAFGFAQTGQTMLNITDGKIIRLYVDDEPLNLAKAELREYRRVLDMQAGTLDRDLIWELPSGKQVAVRSRRLVSFEHRHVAAISYEVTVLNADAPIMVVSQLLAGSNDRAKEGDPRLSPGFEQSVLVPEACSAREGRLLLSHRTRASGMSIACGAEHVMLTDCQVVQASECDDDAAQVAYSIDARAGAPVHLVKYLAYHTGATAPARELCARTERTLDRVVGHGFDELLASQRRCLDEFWRRSDIEVDAEPPRAQQSIRFNLFHLHQATVRAEDAGVGARGLTGPAYEGHYFWDTEIYVLPFLTYTSPQLARNLLKVRYQQLDKARHRAAEVNQKGALYPWRTITGEEASAYYAAGTAQYHINADIVYALRKYVEATGDVDFLDRYGAEMVVETARLWEDLGFYPHDNDGQFHIHGVTGPDEYTAVVNDNTYTNLMARENLRFAVRAIEDLRRRRPDHFAALAATVGLDPSEIDAWRRAAEHMHVVYDEQRGIHPQDDSFLEKEMWDLEGMPPDKFPLMLHYHPLVIYRFQVIKQADVVLAMFLLGHEFTTDQKRRNFDYYDPLTTGDSSLSACIQAIVAWEIGREEKAFQYFRYALLMDLADVGGNVRDGAHIAAMGGTWMTFVYGVAGMRDHGGELRFRPRMPSQLRRLRFPLLYRGRRIVVTLDREQATYTLEEGDDVVIHHHDDRVELSPGVGSSLPIGPAAGVT